MNGSQRLALLLPDMTGGGAERVALRLIEDFLAHGHEVDLLLLRVEGELLQLVPPQVRVIDLKAPRLRSALRPLIHYFRTTPPHALQVLMWPLTIIAIAAHRLARSKSRLITSEHTTLSRQYGDLGAPAFAALRKSIAWFYPLADARVAVSDNSAQDLAKLSGIDRSKFEVIYNPVALPPPRSGGEEKMEQLWGVPRGGRILTVGKLKPEKNHQLLIRAFAQVLRDRQARLMIVGDGPLREELRAFTEREGLTEHVHFAGFHTDTWPFYRSADLFVLSSEFEGYPLVLIEAMRSGVSVVSTDCESGPREILDGGRYGRLVPVGDVEALAEAMRDALEHPMEPALLQARAEALSGQSTSDRYLALMLGE